MSEPLIQVVDENDRPIRAVPKSEVWKTGDRHRIVWIVIQDKNDRILLQKRQKTRELYPGKWDISVSGHIDNGETYRDAGIREVEEELGLAVSRIEEIGKFYKENEFEGRKLNRFYKVYTVMIDSSQEIKIDHTEVEKIKWFTRGEIKNLIVNQPEKVTDGLKEFISRYYS